jgi:hypothetical protein
MHTPAPSNHHTFNNAPSQQHPPSARSVSPPPAQSQNTRYGSHPSQNNGQPQQPQQQQQPNNSVNQRIDFNSPGRANFGSPVKMTQTAILYPDGNMDIQQGMPEVLQPQNINNMP